MAVGGEKLSYRCGDLIQDEQGGQYYFNAKDYTHGKQKPIVDQRVRFTLVDKLDRKKNEVKKNAVDISII